MKNGYKPLTEVKVLKKLGIDDFRHISKDKVIKMATMLDKMDPEVAKKALDQFPEFSTTIESMLHDYKELLEEAMGKNYESLQSCYNSYDLIIESCKTLLEKEKLSFEEKKEVLNMMIEVAKLKDEKDSENKRHIITLVGFGFAAIGSAALVLVNALGGNSNIESDS